MKRMINKIRKKGFTIVELLAVIVILAVIILIAVTAVIPRMNKAKKKALLDEALVYVKAAEEAFTTDSSNGLEEQCYSVSYLNEEYVKKEDINYYGAVRLVHDSETGEVTPTVSLSNGEYFVYKEGDIASADVVDEKPQGFVSSCAFYSPTIYGDIDTNSLAYKLIMNEGEDTFEENVQKISDRTDHVFFSVAETDSAKSGLYASEDDDGGTFYYRGVINNNWVSFAGFYWRIVRINGDGSIKLIYSGTASSNHTGANAAIKNSKNATTTTYVDTTEYTISVPDASGLTTDNIDLSYVSTAFGHNYSGYMYDSSKTLGKYNSGTLGVDATLNDFTIFTEGTSSYYYFKNFDLNQNCTTGGDNGDASTCYLSCSELGNDCIYESWATMLADSNNFSSTAAGVYPENDPTKLVYTNEYKYVCWGRGAKTAVTKENSNGTTSVYITCPFVFEILGSDPDYSTGARGNFYGPLPTSENVIKSKVKDSNLKKEIDLWYESKILGKKIGTDYVEDYLADGVFCNDLDTAPEYRYGSGSDFAYAPIARSLAYTPSLKCNNIETNGYTLGSSSSSRVASTKQGNNKLKYPVGLITLDEALMAGGKNGTSNTSYYLNTGAKYYLMSASHVAGNVGMVVSVYVMNASGRPYSGMISPNYANGIRPVINLKANIYYDAGSGTEADPYTVKLSL